MEHNRQRGRPMSKTLSGNVLIPEMLKNNNNNNNN